MAGTGRSGSTVLANLLGETPGCVSVGELRYVWSRGLVEDRLCGCGEPFSGCPFWGQVRDRLEPDECAGARLATLLRIRRLPRLLLRRPDRLRADLGPLAAALTGLYAAIDQVQPGVIVDSSKLPSYARLLESLPELEVTVVHLVRDPRAAAFSWTRHKPLTDKKVPAVMERRGAVKSTALWLLWNGLLGRRAGRARYVRLRYEDLVADPAGAIARILAVAGLDPQAPPTLAADGRSVRLGVHHTVAGNPARMAQGTTPLRLDDEWRTAMPRPDRMLVTAGAAPLMRRYGYRLRRGIR
ncbi:MAG TPA: sulfotransferase [Mycobacteriales bacterium]|nr:sulfotransferase [Mycobacteriales bacterium]